MIQCDPRTAVSVRDTPIIHIHVIELVGFGDSTEIYLLNTGCFTIDSFLTGKLSLRKHLLQL